MNESTTQPTEVQPTEPLIGPLTAVEWCEFRMQDDDLLACCGTTSEMRDAIFHCLRMGGETCHRGAFALAYADMLDHGLPQGRGGELLGRLRAFYLGDWTDEEIQERAERVREHGDLYDDGTEEPL